VVLAVRAPWSASHAQTLLMSDGTDKVSLVARVEGDAGAFTAACVHLKWSETDDLPMRQLEQVLALVDERGPGPAVVAGDLNFDVVESSQWPSLTRMGWRSCYADDPSPTWCADGRARKLDALLVRGLDVLSVRPLAGVEPSTGLPSALEPSDHLPLVADVR
jgi:endonuclease/exonuclease/phosphatase family metal-dependent hydrolase